MHLEELAVVDADVDAGNRPQLVKLTFFPEILSVRTEIG
jgi:hypothetical protein